MRCAIYVRVSTDEQRDSLKRFRKDISRNVEKRPLKYLNYYVKNN